MATKQASRYMRSKFEKDFEHGMEFWTGEDGDLVSIAITRRPDWANVLNEQYHHRFESRHEKFDASRGRKRFVRRRRAEPEEWSSCRRVWECCDEPTPFPVIEYELKFPQ